MRRRISPSVKDGTGTVSRIHFDSLANTAVIFDGRAFDIVEKKENCAAIKKGNIANKEGKIWQIFIVQSYKVRAAVKHKML